MHKQGQGFALLLVKMEVVKSNQSYLGLLKVVIENCRILCYKLLYEIGICGKPLIRTRKNATPNCLKHKNFYFT